MKTPFDKINKPRGAVDCDTSELIGVPAPPSAIMETRDIIENALLECGAQTISETDLDYLEATVEDGAVRLAGEFLRRIMFDLDGTPTGAALSRQLLGSTESVRDTAARIGCTHPAILKHEKYIRERLKLPQRK